MTQFDRVCNSDNLNFRVFHRFFKSSRSAPKQREIRWTVCTVKMKVLLHIYSISLGVKLPECLVNK